MFTHQGEPIVVNHASWEPAYELHATTSNSGTSNMSVSLRYRACVTQSTGEDWSNVALRFSTTKMNLAGDTIPELRPTRIQPTPSYRTPMSQPSTRGGSVTTNLFGNAASPSGNVRGPASRSVLGGFGMSVNASQVQAQASFD